MYGLPPSTPKLDDWVSGRSNNFDLLRLCGALLVIFAHQFSLVNLPPPMVPFVTGIHYGTLGVYIFFVVSGFLITKSFLDNPDIIRFIRAAFL